MPFKSREDKREAGRGTQGWHALGDRQSLKRKKQTGHCGFQAPAAEAAKAGTVPSATSLRLLSHSVACRESAAGQLSQDSGRAVRSGSRLQGVPGEPDVIPACRRRKLGK